MLRKEQSQYVLRKKNILIMAVIHLCSLTHQLDQVIEKYQFACSIEIYNTPEPGVKAVLCRPPLFSIKTPVKWDVVSFVNNVQYGEEGVRVWRSGYKIGRGKFIPWSKFHTPDQDEVPTLECSAASENIKANFVPIKPRRAEFAEISQKHQDSTDEGTDDSSEESRDSTTKIFFSARKRVALSPINAIRHYRSISNVGDTNMFLNMKLFMTAPC